MVKAGLAANMHMSATGRVVAVEEVQRERMHEIPVTESGDHVLEMPREKQIVVTQVRDERCR